MRKINTQHLFTFIVITIAALLLLGCAAKKPFWGNEKTGFILSYRLEKDQVLQYSTTSETIMSMEAMGQSMDINTDFMNKYTILGSGTNDENNLIRKVTIDDMAIKVSSMQGDVSHDMSKIKGRSFDKTFSSKGKEFDFAGIDDLKIDLGQMAGGERSIKTYFLDILSDLPDNPVKIGDSWIVKDEKTIPQSGMEVKIVTTAVNKLEGYETVDGFECLKIVTKAKNTSQGSGEAMGAQLDIEGDGEIEATWYFAYKTGTLVKVISDSFGEGTIAMSGPQDMTIPYTQEVKTEIKLVSPVQK